MQIAIAGIGHVDLSNVDDLVEQFDHKPSISVKQGVENFAVWYKEYNE